MIEALYDRYRDRLEDFWGRKGNAPRYVRRFRFFGWPLELASNHAGVLAAGDVAARMYTRAEPVEEQPFRVEIVVRDIRADPGPLPGDLVDKIRYTGASGWIHVDLGAWGTCFADLPGGRGTAIISPRLAEDPGLVARLMLNTLITNFITRAGYGMLHATGLVRNGRLLLLMAPHNSGKSTTALRLALSGGFRLLSDSMMYVRETGHGLQLTGFPAGYGKLRGDMVPAFPQLAGVLRPEKVRDEMKYVVDLRTFNPELVFADAFFPGQVAWCLLTRSDGVETTVGQVSPETLLEAYFLNSLHYDEKPPWMTNLRQIERLAGMAQAFSLSIGTDGQRMVAEITGLVDRLGS